MTQGLNLNVVKKLYSVGFMFDRNREWVALIKKARPEWQKGLLNGIGGHIENGETPLEAMVREFKEETGLLTELSDWELYVHIVNEEVNYQLYIFRCFYNDSHLINLRNEDIQEPIYSCSVSNLPLNIIPNLRWLIPLALDKTIKFPLLLQDTGN